MWLLPVEKLAAAEDRRDREHAGIPGGRIGPGHGVQTVMIARRTVAGPLALALVLSGCLGPVSLHQAVLGYDDTVSRLGREMLLVNIDRKSVVEGKRVDAGSRGVLG